MGCANGTGKRDKLSSVSQVDAYPMPRTDDLNDNLVQAQFTTLDHTRGYWQVPMSEVSHAKTPFTNCFCPYQFQVIPLGHNVHPNHCTSTHMAHCGKFYWVNILIFISIDSLH